MDRFGRRYKLVLETKTKNTFVDIAYPTTLLGLGPEFADAGLTLEFNVNRNNLASVSTATFTLYNLSPEKRAMLVKDRMDTSDLRSVTFNAGYEGFMPEAFRGEIRSMQSFRRGPDYITQIECWSGGFDMSNTILKDLSLPSGASVKKVLEGMLGQLKNISKVVIGESVELLRSGVRGTVSEGNVITRVRELISGVPGYTFFIDNQVAYGLKDNHVLVGELQLIDDTSGILETPKKQDKIVDVTIMFEPRLRPSQAIKLISKSGRNEDGTGGTDSPWNGDYKVVGIQHSGTISPVECGPCTTTISLLRPEGALVPVKG